MNDILSWTETALNSLKATLHNIIQYLPKIIGAIVLLLIGWLIARVLRAIILKVLRGLRFEKLMEKTGISGILHKIKLKKSGSELIAWFVYWIIFLVFLMTAADYLQLQVVSESIKDLVGYLPQLFTAIVIFLIGYYLAGVVKKGVFNILSGVGVGGGRLVSYGAYYIILFLITLTALAQAGVDISIITDNVSIVIAGVLLAFAIGFGISSPDVLRNILATYYSRHNFQIGQKIKFDGVEGVIEKIDTVSFTVKTTEGRAIFPTKVLLSEKILLMD